MKSTVEEIRKRFDNDVERFSNLETLKGHAYREHVFAYIEKEDTPRPLIYQLDLLSKSGFDQREILHANAVFAAFGGIKATKPPG